MVVASILASPALATDRISIAPGLNGPINAISEPDANGTRYLGGSFTAFDAWGTGGGALVGASTGAVNTSFPQVTGNVLASAADGSGGFYIGGEFTAVGGVARNRAAHINADGTLDTNWNPDLGSGTVRALAVSGSTVYLGGFLLHRGRHSAQQCGGGWNRRHMTRTWDPNVDNSVNALAISGSTVYLGGSFSTVGVATRNRAAAVGTDGTLKDWDPNVNNSVNALAISGSTVYLGGHLHHRGRHDT